MSFWSWLTHFFRRKPVVTAGGSGSAVGGAPVILVPGNPGKALLVGINAYPDAPLSGCVNDVKDIKALLMGRYGMPESRIKMLLDKAADTAGIREGLKWLCSDVLAGSACCLWYSGHGAQVPTDDSGEPDGLSEVLVPWDFDWSPERMLTDKQLVALLAAMPPGIRFNWGSDSCHSGDLDREIQRPKRRAKQLRHPPKVFAKIQARLHSGSQAKGIRGLLNGALDVGFISGCKSNQTSADTEVGGEPCGAFTHYFLEALKTFPNDAQLLKVVLDTQRLLKNNGYSQQPQGEGPQVGQPFMR